MHPLEYNPCDDSSCLLPDESHGPYNGGFSRINFVADRISILILEEKGLYMIMEYI